MSLRSTLILALLAVGCRYPLPAASSEARPKLATASPLQASARRVDITPPPGVSTFGYATDARVSDGVWTRLYCRVFAFETASHERLAIVPCELAAISTLLQREVAARVADVLPATRVMLTATHTHAGPAHYFDGLAFNNAFSTTLPGFDPSLVRLLARRIAYGVRRAFDGLRPALLRWGHYEGGTDASQGLWGISRNRSLGAHEANYPTQESRHLLSDGPAGLSKAQLAIDSSLHVLRIDELDEQATIRGPIGALAFFAMHPTVLSHANRLLGGDTHGVVSREVERSLRGEWSAGSRRRDPLVGVVNTNEGDIAPDWRQGTKSEAIAIGRRIAERIDKLMPRAEPAQRSVLLDVRYREVDLRFARAQAGRARWLCEVPEPGESFAHGGCDHPSEFDRGLLLPGAPLGADCQRPKRGLAGALGALVAGGNAAFPSRVPLAVVQLDDTLISFVPAELTIVAGDIVKRKVMREGGGRGASHAVIAGLANGYLLYVTTYREFQYQAVNGGCGGPAQGRKRQSYEAGANLYGPWTAAFLAEQLGLLARSLRQPFARELRTLEPAIGEATSFSVPTGFERPRLAPRPPLKTPRDPSARPQMLCTLERETETPTLCFAFADLPPGPVPAWPTPWLQLRREADARPVELERARVDDRGWNFVTRIRGLDDGTGKWSALMRLSEAQWSALGDEAVFLSVGWADAPPKDLSCLSAQGRARSIAFSRGRLPPACDPRQAAWCGIFDENPVTHPPWNDPPQAQPEAHSATCAPSETP